MSTIISNPSPYQQAIFDWIENGRGHGMVNAVAGSGKTSTIVHAASLIKTEALFLAFNKHIARELSARMAGSHVEVKTIHAAGMKALRDEYGSRLRVESDKSYAISLEIVNQLSAPDDGFLSELEFDDEDREEIRRWSLSMCRSQARCLAKFIDMARQWVMDLDDDEEIDFLDDTYDIGIHPALRPYALKLVELGVKACVQQYRSHGVIDFVDMIWMPGRVGARPKRYPFVFLDECQDLSRAQVEMVMACCAPGGRVLAVGDRRQAIYAFAGANAQSIAYLEKTLEPHMMPLSICYRCDREIVKLAQQYASEIEATETSAMGVVRSQDTERSLDEMRDGDLVLCRTTAPLVQACLQLIRSGISAAVKGRDLKKSLERAVREVASRNDYHPGQFEAELEDWLSMKRDAIYERDMNPDREEQLLAALEDTFDTLMVLWRGIGNVGPARTRRELLDRITDIFDCEKPSVTLSTVHRAKGLEADRVYLLRPDLMPHPMAKSGEARMQEYNLIYVAYTRAKHELVLVEDDLGGNYEV